MSFSRACTLIAASSATVVAFLGASATAQAAGTCDRFAAPGGSDSNSGSMAAPFETAQRLVNSINAGEAGCFRGGTYTFSELRIERPSVTLRPYGDEQATLKGAIKVLPAGAGLTIEDLHLNGKGGLSPIGPRIYADDVTLRGNEITNENTAICVTISQFYSDPIPQGVLIERNRIHDCGQLPSTNYHHGIYLSEARDTVIRDNWIYDNADRGIQQYPEVRGTVITGNVIAGNGDGINFSGTGTEVTKDSLVTGNIVVDSKLGYNAYSGGDGPDGVNNVFRDNCVRSRSESGSGIEPNARSFSASSNLVASPDFVDPASGDFRLGPGSGCLAEYAGTMSLPTSPEPEPTPDPELPPEAGSVDLDAKREKVRKGNRLGLRGTIEPAAPLEVARVAIERRVHGSWRVIARPALSPAGSFSTRLRPRSAGVLKLRATLPGGGTSDVVRVRVRR